MCLTAASTHAATASVTLQSYVDPDRHFTISYPQGWHVKHVLNQSTSFYLDDPDDGTTLNVIPTATFKGQMDAAHVWEIFLTASRKQYPDLKVVGEKTRPMEGKPNGTITEIAVTWTNKHGQPMRGWGEIGALKIVGQGRTVIIYEGYQAPAATFDQVEPVFDRMLKSFKLSMGR